MKAIMISDKPRWCALMMNGIKKTEVRKGTALYKATKKLIDEYGYAEFYVYCTKGKQGIFKERHNGYTLLNQNKWIQSEMNGKVLFKFRCYKVEEIKQLIGVFWVWGGHPYYTDNVSEENLLNRSCLSATELENYLKGKIGYAIHISDLEIFDRPKELSEFSIKVFPHRKDNLMTRYLTRAPQSWCYVEVEQ